MAPAAVRLARLVPLGSEDIAALASAAEKRRIVRARRDLVTEGQDIGETRLIVDGWAARVRQLADGRRLFLSFLLPGDLIGLCRQPQPLAVSTVIALTEVSVCAAPSASSASRLDQAYAISHALEEAYLLSHITRLGRLNAQERIGDFLLEIYERLSMAGLASTDGFDVPLTQESMADALGLTPVHVNRMLQSLRREGDLDWKGRRVTLHDPASLAAKVGRAPIRVTRQPPP